ncbi:isocitrate lyase/PEP mutase family protein [Catenulispora rubra]|uniref:isocitrate lyase/PEP mutase family protein n=1 Tax=Catenulispora rubra TaxID=280293 RepID=UPI00189277C9|nr:isocitrate lyase/phosphoenolpyruvate mutase family protein [Catenulispora rubra]
MTSQHDKATRFHALHVPGTPLALANAWDGASARIVASTGAPAVATTSAGVAWGLGAADGGHLDRERAVALIRRVVDTVEVPVTADIEDGFGPDADAVAETVAQVIAAGAIGVNIEDGPRDPAELAARITAARKAADNAGIPLFVNARIDVFLFGLGAEQDRLGETLARAERYLAAGASGVFVPGVAAPETIAELVKGIDAPLNVMVGPGAPTVAELAALGVARVSLGAAVAEAAYGLVRRAAEELAKSGTYTAVEGGLPYPELNGLMS